jgi:hypothetical protein
MTIEELDIIVNASVEKAVKEFKKLTPSIKKQLSKIQKEFNNVNIKDITAKVNISQVSKEMKKAKKQIQNIFDPGDISNIIITHNKRKFKLKNINIKGYSREFDALKGKTYDMGKMIDISNYKKKLEKARIELEKAKKEAEGKWQEIPIGKGFKYDINLNQKFVDNYNKVSEIVSKTKQEQTKLKQEINKTKESTKSLKNTFNQMPKITQNITNYIKGMGNSLKDGIGKVLRYAVALIGLRSIYQTLKNCATSWLSSQNAQAQQLSANIEYMKYAMGSVFAPIIQFVTNLIYNLMKAVQSLVYAFSGVNIFAKATANSMKSASNSAKQTNKSLSSVHSEINNVSDNNSNENGSATPSIDLSQVDNSMLTWANKWKEKLSKFFAPFKEAWNNQGQKTINSAKNAFERIKEAVISVGKSWNEVWSSGTGQQTIELILKIFQNICDSIANIANAWNNAWNTDNKGTELIQTMWDALNKLLTLIEILTNKIKEFTSDPIVQEYFQNAIEMVTNFLKALGGLIEFLTGVFTGDWEKAWSGLKDFVSGIFGMIWNVINSKILMVKAIISNVLEGIKNTWSNIWDGIKNFATNIWDNLLNKIDSIFPGMRNIIETNIINVKNKINEVLNSIKSIWNNIWGGIKNKTSEIWNNIWLAIRNPINWILGGVEKMTNGVVTGVNKVIRSLNNMHFKMPDWLGGGSFGINMPTMSGVSLPRLAKGNVAYDETLAVFGEYSGARSNPEITAPQSIMRETFEDVLSNYEGSKSNNSGELKTLVIQFGSTKVALEMERLLQQARRQNGTAYAEI